MSKAINLTPTNSPYYMQLDTAIWSGGGAVPTVWASVGASGNSVTVYAGYGSKTLEIAWSPGTVAVNTTWALTSRCDYLKFVLTGTGTDTIVGVAGN